MKKRVLGLLMAILLCLPFAVANAATKTSADFSDLKDLDAATKAKFDALISAGVFDGVDEGKFGIKDEMNRAQFAKVASLIFNLKVDTDMKTSSFKDVKADDPANGYALPYIEAVKAAGITDGYGEGTFNPAGKVTKEQLATFLVRGLGMNEDAKKTPGVNDATVSDWAKGYVALALEKKILSNGADGKFGGTSRATRDLLVTGAYEAKEQYVVIEQKKKEEEEKKKEEEEKEKEKEESAPPPIYTPPYVPPTLPTVTVILGGSRSAGSRTAEVLVTPSVTGTVYSVVTDYNSPTPSSAYIAQGLAADGQPALDYQYRRVSVDFQDSLVVGNSLLNDDTSYDVYVVVKDDAGNVSVPREIIITTPSAAILDSATIALNAINAYAAGGPAVDENTFAAAGVLRVTSSNLAVVLDALDADGTHPWTVYEIQVIVDLAIDDVDPDIALGAINAYFSMPDFGPTIDHNTFAAAGVMGVTESNLEDVLTALELAYSTPWLSASQIQTIVNSVLT